MNQPLFGRNKYLAKPRRFINCKQTKTQNKCHSPAYCIPPQHNGRVTSCLDPARFGAVQSSLSGWWEESRRDDVVPRVRRPPQWLPRQNRSWPRRLLHSHDNGDLRHGHEIDILRGRVWQDGGGLKLPPQLPNPASTRTRRKLRGEAEGPAYPLHSPSPT